MRRICQFVVVGLGLLAGSVRADVWVYREALEAGWDNWSWSGTYQFTATPAQSGTYALAVQTDAWGGLSLHHASLTRSSYGGVEFYARASSNRPSVTVQLQDDVGGTSSGYVDLDDEAYWPAGRMTNTAWRRCYVPMAAFPSAPASFTRINVFNNNPAAQPRYLIDNLRLTDVPVTPPAMTMASAITAQRAMLFLDQAVTPASAAAAAYRLQNAADPNYATPVAGSWVATVTAAQAVVVSFPYAFRTAGVYAASASGLVASVGGAVSAGTTGRFSLVSQTATVLVNQATHRISPFIYGVAFASGAAYLRDAGMTLNRWGGNNSTKYNWTIGAANLDNDWYFENIDWDGADGSGSAPAFAERNAAAGAATILSIPTLDWVAKDKTSHSFSVAKYGAQDGTDPYRPDAGNGMKSGVAFTNNNPADASVPSRPFVRAGDPTNAVYQDAWLRSLRQRYGATATGLLPFLAMDNESDIWGTTHRDVHPAPATYDELLTKFLTYATMAKSNFPGARILGPVSTGWWFFWNSDAGWADKGAHGNQDFLPWFLDNVRQHDLTTGVRTLDFLDLHHYPNVATGGTTAEQQAARIRAVRTFWDTNYTDEGWIGTDHWATETQANSNRVALIPRFRALLAAHYPGTRLAVTEWNMGGGESDVSGALSAADALGVFGRERLDMACHWTAPATNSSVFQAFKLFGNADGQGSRMQDLCVPARSGSEPVLGVYAARNAAGDVLSLVAVNKNPTQDLLATISLVGAIPGSTAQVWQIHRAFPDRVLALPAASVTGAVWTAALPAYSATLLHLSLPAAADADGDGLSDLWERAHTNVTVAGSVPFIPGGPEATADHDGDGVSSVDELAAGTDPTDPLSLLRIAMHREGTNWFLGATAPPAHPVIVERSAGVSGPWLATTNTPWREAGTNGPVFFRLRQP